jgi:3-oxoacyl-[acyl-carrier-protein] synthase II
MGSREKPRRVVVTGYGAICSMGGSSAEIWDAMMASRVGYRRTLVGDQSVQARFFGFLEADRQRYRTFPKAITRLVPEYAKYALVAAKEALDMAFGREVCLDDHYGPFERAVVIGTGWGGLDTHNENHGSYQNTGLASSFSTLAAMGNAAGAAISINWQMRGYQSTPVAACATGSVAIGEAYEAIRSGRAGMALAGASESMKDNFNVWSIDVMGALSKEQDEIRLACCPFSRGRSGFVLSEGSAVLCLEELDGAVRRGATLLGEVTGYGNSADATDMTAPAEDLLGRIHAIRHAMRSAGRAAKDIGYVNTHGTSTPANDVNENEAIKAALGAEAYGIPMSSTKSYTGHLVSAAGSMEAIFCLKALQTGIVPATIHLDEPDPACDLNYVPNTHLRDQDVTAALNLSFGFGGTNAALVLERVA